jgi:hypothetical protein
VAPTCDTHALTLAIPADYWTDHEGAVQVEITWESSADDLDLYVKNSAGDVVGESAAGGTTKETAALGKLAPGTYTVEVSSYLSQPEIPYSGTASLSSTALTGPVSFPESKDTVENLLTVDYPLNVVFVGRTPTEDEVTELRQWIPESYRPTVATKSPTNGDFVNSGAGLLNWNKSHYLEGEQPYFLGIRYNYTLRILTASDDYARALYGVAEGNTAPGQAYRGGAANTRTVNQVKYDATYGNYRVVAKDGDPTYKVTDPSKTDLVDAYSVEDWMFNSRTDARWSCAFKDVKRTSASRPR